MKKRAPPTLHELHYGYLKLADQFGMLACVQSSLLDAVRGLTDAQRVNTEKLNKIAAFLAQLEAMGR